MTNLLYRVDVEYTDSEGSHYIANESVWAMNEEEAEEKAVKRVESDHEDVSVLRSYIVGIEMAEVKEAV